MKRTVIVLMFILVTMLYAVPAYASAQNTSPEGETAALIISVVEEIPADDIEDSAVPLAAPRRSAGFKNGYIAAIAAAAIIIFFIARELIKRYRLRKIFMPYAAELYDDTGEWQH